MFDDNKVNQEGLVAGRDIAGRDINITYNLHASPIFHEDSTLKALLIEHEKEKKMILHTGNSRMNLINFSVNL